VAEGEDVTDETRAEPTVRERIRALLAAEKQELDLLIADSVLRPEQDQSDRPAVPRWRAANIFGTGDGEHERRVVEGTDGLHIYDEGGHSEHDAAHIARHDPLRGMHEIQLYRVILDEHRVTVGRPINVLTGRDEPQCRCGDWDPCRELMALLRVLEDPGPWAPERPRQAFVRMAPFVTRAVLTMIDGSTVSVEFEAGQAVGGSAPVTVTVPGATTVALKRVDLLAGDGTPVFWHEWPAGISVAGGNSVSFPIALD
jgi:hypothetical protein